MNADPEVLSESLLSFVWVGRITKGINLLTFEVINIKFLEYIKREKIKEIGQWII